MLSRRDSSLWDGNGSVESKILELLSKASFADIDSQPLDLVFIQVLKGGQPAFRVARPDAVHHGCDRIAGLETSLNQGNARFGTTHILAMTVATVVCEHGCIHIDIRVLEVVPECTDTDDSDAQDDQQFDLPATHLSFQLSGNWQSGYRQHPGQPAYWYRQGYPVHSQRSFAVSGA